MEPEGELDDNDAEFEGSVSAMEALLNFEGMVKVLRWAAAAAFLIWVFNAFLTAWSLWDASASTTGGFLTQGGIVGGEELTTAERLRGVISGTIQSSSFFPLVAVIAYGFAALLSRPPSADLGDD